MQRFAIAFILSFSTSIAAAAPAKHSSIPALTVADEGGAALALESVSVRTIVRGHLARTEYELTYRNDLPRDLSGDFNFPLPEDAEVSDIGLYFDGHLRHGVAIERAQAKAAYEETVHRHVDPALAEWSSGRSFRFRVYPIPGQGTKVVHIAYDQELTAAPYRLDLGYGVTLKKLDIDIDAGEARVTSTLPLARGGDRWSLHATNTTLDGTITIERDPLEVAMVSYSPSDGLWYASAPVRVRPRARSLAPASRIALLWDASGSAAARDDAAVCAFLRAFAARQNPSASLTVIPFALDVGAPQQIDAASLDCAGFAESGGATNFIALFQRLPQIAAEMPDARFVLVTDGVSTLGGREHLTRAAASLASLRRPIAVVNASASSDDVFLRSIADSTGGWLFDLQRDAPEAAADAAMHLPARSAIVATPTLVRDVFPASLISAAETTVVVNGRSPSHIVSLPITIDGVTREIAAREVRDAGDLVRRAWARARLRQLIASGARDEVIVEHGQRFNQLTPRTSLLILESWRDYVAYDVPLPDDLREQKTADEAKEREQLRLTQARRENWRVYWFHAAPLNAKWFVKGHVMDNAGDPLPGVIVTLTAPNWEPLITVTDQHGEYWLANTAAPPSFGIKAELEGLNTAVRRYDSAVAKGAVIDMTMSAAVTESITVTAAAPSMVDESSESLVRQGATLAMASLQQRHLVIEDVVAKLRSIRSADERYREFVLARAVLGGQKLFHVAAAEAFRDDAPELALRVLTDLAEAYPDDAPLLRILGRVADGWGYADVARLLFERALELSPRETQTWRELILLEARLRNTKGVEDWTDRFAAARRDWRMKDVETQLDEELVRAHAGAADARIDPTAKLQVELMFDTNYSYVDLHIVEPFEEVTWNHDRSANGGFISGWLTEGFGPEVYVNKGGVAGDYRIDLQYYSSDGAEVSRESLSHVIVYNRGERSDYLAVLRTDNERKTVATVRLR